jgi:NAD(P)-dependent dehydrogenase (short-subunit alcohol dehydrogenase family)
MSSPVVLITGALTGIGRATALAFAKDGAQIVGARPTRAAICLRPIFPSSGSRAMSVKASTGPTPGIEVSSS